MGGAEHMRESLATGAAVRGLRTPIGIAGCGVEGLGTLSYLRRHGVADLRLFDRTLAAQRDRGEALPPAAADLPVFGDPDWAIELPRCGTVFRSPGVRPDHPALTAARDRGAVITSATDWFLRHCPGTVVGVTGTVGKGTTATLIHEALRAAGLHSRLAGNIGLNPLAFLDEVGAGETVVLELSSFQLMDLGPVKPVVAVVLRTSQDHLDWHPTVEEYLRAKAGLIAPGGRLPDGRRQAVVFCADPPGSRAVVELGVGQGLGSSVPGVLAVSRAGPVSAGVGVRNGQVWRFGGGTERRLAPLEHLQLPGAFNLENAAAAYLAAEALGADAERALAALAAFPGLPHRLERVGTVRAGTESAASGHGIACYNDSYATRPDATLAALSAFEGPLALILGGSEKHADFRALAEGICRHPGLRAVLLIGATAERLRSEIGAAAGRTGRPAPTCTLHPGLPEAFAAGLAALEAWDAAASPAGPVAASGERVLLLSPACASFGLFPNYKVRGERFKALVQAAGG